MSTPVFVNSIEEINREKIFPKERLQYLLDRAQQTNVCTNYRLEIKCAIKDGFIGAIVKLRMARYFCGKAFTAQLSNAEGFVLWPAHSKLLEDPTILNELIDYDIPTDLNGTSFFT